MKIRITKMPVERELDGMRLDVLRPGTVREVSALVGSWLIAQGYAEPEMRSATRLELDGEPVNEFSRNPGRDEQDQD